jgi:hypothetical protein
LKVSFTNSCGKQNGINPFTTRVTSWCEFSPLVRLSTFGGFFNYRSSQNFCANFLLVNVNVMYKFLTKMSCAIFWDTEFFTKPSGHPVNHNICCTYISAKTAVFIRHCCNPASSEKRQKQKKKFLH